MVFISLLLLLLDLPHLLINFIGDHQRQNGLALADFVDDVHHNFAINSHLDTIATVIGVRVAASVTIGIAIAMHL